MNFYLYQNGQQIGPYSIEQVRTFLQQGLAKTSDQIWSEGWPSWLAISEVPGLAEKGVPRSTGVLPKGVVRSVKKQIRSAAPTKSGENGEIYAEGKNPVLSCFMSFMIAGAGQFYNGDWGKGWFLLITVIAASILSFGTLWIFWAVMAAVDAYLVAAQKRPLRGSFYKF